MTKPLLTVKDLTMRFGGLVAVDRFSFEAQSGHITAIIGPNGAGKTTAFNCITGFYKPSGGSVTLHHPSRGDFSLETMEDHKISRIAKVARTFQNIRLFGGMTVLENLMISQHNELMRASMFSIAGIFGLPSYRRAEKEAIEKSMAWLERIGIADKADEAAAALPYGQQRKLEIVRALCTDPVLLCLDEPAAGLNPKESDDLGMFLREIRDKDHVGILLIEHDMTVVMEISDHIVVLDYGRKISDGTPAHVRNDAAVIKAYLGVDE